MRRPLVVLFYPSPGSRESRERVMDKDKPTLALRKSGPNGGRSLNSAADELCVNPRTLRKWDAANGATAPDSVVKLLSYVVGLDMLEALERAGPVSLHTALGGDLTVKRLRAYLDEVFAEHDPLNDRTDPSR